MASMNVESQDSVLHEEIMIHNSRRYELCRWEKSLSAVALPFLGFAFLTAIDCSAGF